MSKKTYSLDEIHRLLDPSQTDYSEYSRHSVRVIEHLMRRVAALEADNLKLVSHIDTLTTAVEDSIDQLRRHADPLGTLKLALDEVWEGEAE